ncbi:hypothetical protein HPB50_003018 [Hyalomma asiaticum]|uniref:Uncharacterized protein n=1 Tax=Hyalomma asiaticum TaxID=266040 RepID=A0ACB7T0G7_HYAAI|nr:hypothetical protein HPB50_003018 [Hyalomma asiaticum]
MDTSTDGVIPKRPSKRNAQPKLSSRSTSTGNSSFPCHQQADLMDLNAHLRTSQKGEGGEHRSDLNINANEKTGPSRATTIDENCDAESARTTKHFVEDCEVATSTVADTQSNVRGDGQSVRIDKPERKGLTGTDVFDIAREMRQDLQKKGRSQEHELVESVRPLHAKLMLQMHGTVTAFLDTRPRCNVVHEDLYSFVYYEDPDGGVQGGSSSHIETSLIPSRQVPTKGAAITIQRVNVPLSRPVDLIACPLPREHTPEISVGSKTPLSSKRQRSSTFSSPKWIRQPTTSFPSAPGKRNVQPKLSSRSTSTGNSSFPCHQQADLVDPNALLRTSQKGEGGEHRSDLNINATEETGPSRATTIHGNCETESACSTQPMAEDGEVSTPTVADHLSSVVGHCQAVRIEIPERKGITGRDLLDIVRPMRQALQKKVPSQERELVEAMSPLHAELTLKVRGSTTAFLDAGPECKVVHEDLYSFVYYEDPDGGVQGGPSSHIKDIPAASLTGFNKRGCHNRTACECASASSRGPTPACPATLQADHTDLNALLRTSRKGEGAEHRSDLAINATEETGPSQSIMIDQNFEDESVRSTKHLIEDCEVATSMVVHIQRNMRGDGRVDRLKKPERKGLNERDLLDIVRHMRQVLQKTGPSQERELLEAVSPLHAKLMLEMQGTVKALLHTHPGCKVVHEDLYSFVYYENPDGGVQGGSSSHIKDIPGPSSTASNKGGRHNNPVYECAPISSSRPARESASERTHLE